MFDLEILESVYEEVHGKDKRLKEMDKKSSD